VNLRGLWTQAVRWFATHSERDRRILAVVGGLIGLSVLYKCAIEPLIHYRAQVKEEIEKGQEQLSGADRFLAAADGLRAERDELRQRLTQAKQRLLPGSSGTLGAAALQERANVLAAEKGITVQSTQVMKEEAVEPFHKIAIRLTLSGELKSVAELVYGLEYGPQQLSIPFLELSRRGAVAGAKGPRTLSATVEVTGYLEGEKAGKAEAEPAEGEVEAAPGAAEPEAPPGPPAEGTPAAPPSPPAAAPPAAVNAGST
jgi:Tfp pilus assembly protein PilO